MSVNTVLRYFPDLSDEQKNQFSALGSLYSEWNEKINVISRKDVDALYERHVLHSLGIAKVLNFASGSRILDIGTGGGFPGIPLAILFPESQFTLVDSIGKKITVVQEVAAALQLQNVAAVKGRAEDQKGRFDFVVSRAVTRMPVFLSWLKNKFTTENKSKMPNGLLYLKGGDLAEELAGLKVKSFELAAFFEEEFFETKKVIYIAAADIKL